MIAALYIDSAGPYMELADVDPWTERRDARGYSGPNSVVAHPPCKRWGRYWGGGPNGGGGFYKGDDGGCFASALFAVRTFGGVLEHPEASHAWAWFGLKQPPQHGGWVRADRFGGWTCCVAQGHYGHPAQKLTWLYAAKVVRPVLRWGLAPGLVRVEEGWRSTEARRQARSAGVAPVARLSAAERLHTPIPFRDLLLNMARSAGTKDGPVTPTGRTLELFRHAGT